VVVFGLLASSYTQTELPEVSEYSDSEGNNGVCSHLSIYFSTFCFSVMVATKDNEVRFFVIARVTIDMMNFQTITLITKGNTTFMSALN